jgi:hypothetical protein
VAAVVNKVSLTAINSIQNVLRHLPSNAKIGIFTFNSCIQFYHVKGEAFIQNIELFDLILILENRSTIETIKLMIVEADDPCPALPTSQWLLPVESRMESIQLLLLKINNEINSIFETSGYATLNSDKSNIAGPSHLSSVSGYCFINP